MVYAVMDRNGKDSCERLSPISCVSRVSHGDISFSHVNQDEKWMLCLKAITKLTGQQRSSRRVKNEAVRNKVQ